MVSSRSRITAGVTAALLVGSLAACSGGGDEDEPPGPDDAARALVDGLTSGDLAEVPFAGVTPAQATTSYTALTDGLGIDPQIVLNDVTEGEGDTATAVMTWTWPVGAEFWEYQSQADLALTGDTWEVTWDPTLVEPTLEADERLDATPLRPARGDVTGARGLALVTDRPVMRFGIDRSAVTKQQAVASARALARLTEIDVPTFVAQVRGSGDKAFVEAITYRREDVPPAVTAGYPALDGVTVLAGEDPLAPTRGFAAPILGTVGEVTAEMIEKDPDTYAAGDRAGLSGLQARYDDTLRGTPGLVIDAVTGEGRAEQERELFRVEPVAGEPLELTLDADLQIEAESALADTAPASSLVAIRPSTGAILAAANGSGTDGVNLATYGQFAPGSTFKTVTSLALLRAGLTPASPVSCTPTLTVDGRRFGNYSDYPSSGIGRIPLRTAVANSCNTAFIAEVERIGGTSTTALFDAAASLGMGLDHDLGFPAFLGSVEPADTPTGAAAAMIGQGTVLASPMSMATVIASVQAGELVIPRLVENVEVTPPDGAKPLTGQETAALRRMLRGVVTDGSGGALADLPGPPVLAKTGTAEFGAGDNLQTHAWMIAAQGDLAVAVFVEVGQSGSRTAGPILERFLRAAG